ncbi:MAG: hypothetical protein GY839_18265 [candidate division Zixibacteria bacterium]|nr:hypothetical protein [candidate division Zixibacteria bacterium]
MINIHNLTKIFLLSAIIMGLNCGTLNYYKGSFTYDNINAADKIIKKAPLNCEEAINQADILDDAIDDLWIVTVGIDYDSTNKVFDKMNVYSIEKMSRLILAIEFDSACVGSYERLGDYAARQMYYSDSLIDTAKYWYRLGLRYAPDDPVLSSHLAFVLEMSDSTDAAKQSYEKAIRDSACAFNSMSSIERINAGSLMIENFYKSEEESYILFERRQIYTLGKPSVAYYKVYADGRCEIKDYTGNSDKMMKTNHTLDSCFIDSLLRVMKSANFMSLTNPFKTERIGRDDIDFHYVSQWHLPDYTITYHLPALEHSVCIYGLGAIYGVNATRDVLSISHIPDLNTPTDSYVMNKLGKLADIYKRLFEYRNNVIN